MLARLPGTSNDRGLPSAVSFAPRLSFARAWLVLHRKPLRGKGMPPGSKLNLIEFETRSWYHTASSVSNL